MNTFFPTNNERVTIDAYNGLFPQRSPVSPKIYAYELIGVASHRGYIKVGYTERDVDLSLIHI